MYHLASKFNSLKLHTLVVVGWVIVFTFSIDFVFRFIDGMSVKIPKVPFFLASVA